MKQAEGSSLRDDNKDLGERQGQLLFQSMFSWEAEDKGREGGTYNASDISALPVTQVARDRCKNGSSYLQLK